MEKLESLIERFQNLSTIMGTDKSSSYEVKIIKDLFYGWFLELGCYDIGDWPRHLRKGPFDSLEALLVEFDKIVIEAKRVVEEEDKKE